MQPLYHFTSRHGIDGIFGCGLIRKGRILTPEQGPEDNAAISLTTDPDPLGHGLPDGREISDEQSIKLGRYALIEGKKYCVDHTKYRLQISSNGLNLISAQEYYQNNLILLKILAVTGYYPVGDDGDPENVPKVDELIREPSFVGKALSWYYAFQEIPLSSVVKVAVRLPDNDYRALSTAEFRRLWEAL